MRLLAYGSLLFSVILLFTGCKTFQIKNTNGLRLAYEDIDRASSKGVELKSLKNVDASQMEAAAELYREVKSAINGYLQQAIIDSAGYTVDKNAESYNSTKANEKVVLFQDKVNSLRGNTKFSAPMWVSTAAKVIAELKKFHDQDQKAAYDRFKETVTKNMMKNFEELPSL